MQATRGPWVLAAALGVTALAGSLPAGAATAPAGQARAEATVQATVTADTYTDTVEMGAADNTSAAIAFSRLTFRDGANEVVIGRDDEFADSFASGGMQGGRPLLLTTPDGLDERTATELERLNTEKVYLLGGERALDGDVEAALHARGVVVQRLSGPTRIETAVAVAETVLPDATTAVLARAFPGEGDDPAAMFIDAVVAGGWAAAEGWPVLLTQPGPISPATAAYLERAGITSVHVVGGPAAVAREAAVQLAALGVEIQRVAGPSRFATGAAVAEARGDAQRFVLVDAQDTRSWAAGFAAAAYSARFGAPILPVRDGELPKPVADLLASDGRRHGLVCGPGVGDAVCHRAAETAGQVRRADADLAPLPGVDGGLRGVLTNPEGVRSVKVIGCGVKRTVTPGADGSFSVAGVGESCRLTVRIEHADGTAFDQAFTVTTDGVKEHRRSGSSGAGGDGGLGGGTDDTADDTTDDGLGGLDDVPDDLSGGEDADPAIVIDDPIDIEPEDDPTENPTEEPAEDSTPDPTRDPTPDPTPDPEPTEDPTEQPTEDPTEEPTEDPTEEPTPDPTPDPDPDPEPTYSCNSLGVAQVVYRATIVMAPPPACPML